MRGLPDRANPVIQYQLFRRSHRSRDNVQRAETGMVVELAHNSAGLDPGTGFLLVIPVRHAAYAACAHRTGP